MYFSSHPTWVRGLKLPIFLGILMRLMSHPTWVRGLKLLASSSGRAALPVAPYVGAWIETIGSKDIEMGGSRTLRGCVD